MLKVLERHCRLNYSSIFPLASHGLCIYDKTLKLRTPSVQAAILQLVVPDRGNDGRLPSGRSLCHGMWKGAIYLPIGGDSESHRDLRSCPFVELHSTPSGTCLFKQITIPNPRTRIYSELLDGIPTSSGHQ